MIAFTLYIVGAAFVGALLGSYLACVLVHGFFRWFEASEQIEENSKRIAKLLKG